MQHPGIAAREDPILRNLVLLCRHSGRAEYHDLLQRRVRSKLLDQAKHPHPFQPYPGQKVDGPVRFGKVVSPHMSHSPWFGLRLHELNQNVLVGGRAGAGKTNLFMILQNTLLGLGLPYLIWDFKKDYRHLVRKHRNLLAFNRRNFKWNPLQPPPGTHFTEWIQVLSDIFFQAFFPATPATASKVVFLEVLERLFARIRQAWGEESCPTLFDLHDALDEHSEIVKTLPGTSRERLRTCRNRIRPLLRILGPMLDCEEGYSLEALLQRPVVFELDGLMEEFQVFIVLVMLYWIFFYRLNTVQRGLLAHVLFIDETKMVLAADRASGASASSRIVSTLREMGEAFVLADQMPSALGHSVLANVFTLISLSLSSAKDIQFMGYAMGLNSEQRQFLNRLPVGSGIVKLADRFPDPFRIEIECFPIRKDVTDEELDRHMAQHLTQLHFRPRRDGVVIIREVEQPQASGQGEDALIPRAAVRPWDLHDKAYMVLEDIKNRPFVTTTVRFWSLHLTNYMGNRSCRQLRDLGLVQEIQIGLGRRGRAGKYYQLTPKAEERLGKQNLGSGKGGFVHVFHQQRLRSLFSARGYEAKIEEYRGGKAVDLGLSRNGRKIALEIAMSPGGEMDNIIKDHRAGWDEIWVVCRDSNTLEQVQSQWLPQKGAFPDCHVSFYLISDPLFDSNASDGLSDGQKSRKQPISGENEGS